MKIAIIGAGNLATHLSLALQNSGEDIIQIFSRTAESASDLAGKLNAQYTTDVSCISNEADLYVYAVSDYALEDLLSENIAPDALHVHTAGSVSIEIFQGKKHNFGVIYPLQTFSKNKELVFGNIPVFIEASSDENLKLLHDLTSKISEKVIELCSEERLKLHIAAVFACNFVNHFYGIAEALVAETGLSFDVLKPLILETADKMNYLNPKEAQTGPSKRNDRNVIDKHLLVLQNQPELQDLYQALSQMIFQKQLHQS
jgi:predicted short-subunit dehydrogenase-like oxidoreductase (DUF2520 family)